MRSGSRSRVESQFDVQDSATRDECEAVGGAQVQDPAVSNRKTTEKGEQHAKRKIDEAPFIFAFVGFWRDSGGDRRVSANRPPAFVSGIGDNTNVVFVENHIVIDMPANEIFDFVSPLGTSINGLLRRVMSSSTLMEVRIGTRKGDTQKPLGWGRKPRPCARCRSRRFLPTGPR